MRRAYTTCLLVLTLFTVAWASSGDRAEDFTQCVQLCKIQNCGAASTYSMPWTLRLTCWTCPEDCNYECMHKITEKHIRRGNPVQQYYGKWPFWRFLGAQEPASVVFSVLNLLVHWKGNSKIKKIVPDNHPMKPYYLRWSLIGVNAWMWSAVFHTRDRPTTEKLDYFSAALAIMYALYFTTLRIFHIYPRSQESRLTLSDRSPRSSLRRILATICTLAFIGHISYLTLLPHFDYTYNVVFNLAVGLTHNLLWTVYSLPSSLSLIHRFPSGPKSYRPSFVGKAGLFVLLTTASTSFELFDFPPWLGIIDAHAFWHLATAPIVLMWYDFLIKDSLDPSWRDQRS